MQVRAAVLLVFSLQPCKSASWAAVGAGNPVKGLVGKRPSCVLEQMHNRTRRNREERTLSLPLFGWYAREGAGDLLHLVPALGRAARGRPRPQPVCAGAPGQRGTDGQRAPADRILFRVPASVAGNEDWNGG